MCFFPFQQSLMSPIPPIPNPYMSTVPPIIFTSFQSPFTTMPLFAPNITQPQLQGDIRKIYLQNQKQMLTQLKKNISEYSKSLDETLTTIDKEISKIEKAESQK